MIADTIRWVVLFEGAFILGTLIALFQRAWRFSVPASVARTLIAASFLTTAATMVGQYVRLGDPLTWRVPTALVVMSLYLTALVRLWIWYQQPEGRKRRHDMIASYMAERVLREADYRHRHTPE